MPRTRYSEYSATPGDNTDIDGINIGEGMAPSDVNNSLRSFLSQTREFVDGSSGDTLTSAKIVATTAEILSGVNVTGTATFNSAVILSSSVTGSALSLSGALTVGGAAILSSTLGVTGTASMGVIDATSLEVTNIKAKDGTASATIADSTGVMTLASAVLTTADINGGTADNVVIGGATPAAATFTTGTATTFTATTVDSTNLEVTNLKAKDGTSAGSIADSTGVVTLNSAVLTTADINGGTADNVVIGGGTAAAGTFTTATATTGNITNVNATTVDSTNLEVTNIKAKDGTAAATIADSTGVVTIPSAVLTTADINGGTVDNAAIGAGTPSTGAFTTLSSNSTTTLNGTTIPASKTLLVSTDIGSTVQGYDADTAKYDDVTANFTGTLQNGGSNVVVDTDIGSTVQAYDADTAKYDDVTANFTGTLQNGGSNVLVDTDIGTNVQAYDAQLADVAGLTPADGAFIVGDGANFVTEDGATARTSLGLGSIATQAANSVDIDGGAVDGITLGTNSAVTEAQIDNVNINGNAIVSSDTDGDLSLTPNGTGDLILDGLKWPQADGTADYVLKTDGSGQLAWTAQSGGGGSGTVTSVDVSGGTTGLTTSGGPITTSGTITLAGTLGVANGGTGATSLTANNVILGNGTSAVQFVAPGTSGNVLTSNGTTWTSAAGGGGGSSITAGDSSVAVTDAGTGKVEVTVDNVEVADFTTGAIVFNETGANQDFRVEGDTNANLIVADAGVDKVGIGTNTFNTNGGVLQVSNGISFPATQSASADANTLDDYEEGTWTPSIGGNATYGSQSGHYTKIGNRVMISGRLNVSVRGTGSQSIVSGLPFTAANVGNQFGGRTAFFTNLAQSVVDLNPLVENNTASIRFATLTSAATGSLNVQNVIQDNTIIDFVVTYQV